MQAMKRLALVASTILVGAAVQVAPVAAGPPGPAAGVSTSSGSSAGFQRLPEDFSLPQINIGISQSTDTFDPQSGPRTSTTQSQLFVSVFNGEDFLECTVQNPTGFVLSSDLSTASVHLTIPEGAEGCITSAFVTFPQTIDVTWVGVGPLDSQQGTSESSCPGYHTESKNSRTSRNASSQASISPLLGDASYAAVQAGMDAHANRTHTQGSAPALCMAGGGRGAGPGPVGPGTYRSSGTGASQELSDVVTGDGIQVQAGTSTFSYNPRTGASTNTTQTTVNLRMNGPSFDRACWVVSQDAFSINNNVTSASLHVTVTEDSPVCPGPFENTLPLPITIDVTWTGIGPDAFNHNNMQSSCGGYKSELSSSSRSNNTSAVMTLSGALEGSFASHQSEHESTGSMGAFDQTIQVQGSPSGCGL